MDSLAGSRNCSDVASCSSFRFDQLPHMGMGQYLLIPFLVEWTSIYQLFWCSPGVQGFDTLPYLSYGWETLRSSLAPKPPKCVSCPTTWMIKSQQVWCGFWQISSNAKKNNAFPIPYTPWCWYSYLHNWVILFGQMLVNIPAPWSIWYGYIYGYGFLKCVTSTFNIVQIGYFPKIGPKKCFLGPRF